MTIQKLELYIHVVDIQHFVCCRRPTAQIYCPSHLVVTCTADPYRGLIITPRRVCVSGVKQLVLSVVVVVVVVIKKSV